jgi:hypothetical protein
MAASAALAAMAALAALAALAAEAAADMTAAVAVVESDYNDGTDIARDAGKTDRRINIIVFFMLQL